MFSYSIWINNIQSYTSSFADFTITKWYIDITLLTGHVQLSTKQSFYNEWLNMQIDVFPL